MRHDIFFRTIMKEIDAMRLPRTLLLAFESIVRYLDRMGEKEAQRFLDATKVEINRILGNLWETIFSDLQKPKDAISTEDGETRDTLDRLGHVVRFFSESEQDQSLVSRFRSNFNDAMESSNACPNLQASYKGILVRSLGDL